MEKELIEIYLKNKHLLKKSLKRKHPGSYYDLVKEVVKVLEDDNYIDSPNCKRMIAIEAGDYNYGGKDAYIIQSSNQSILWSLAISYGSCAECDILEGIRNSRYECLEKPTQKQIEAYLHLSLHIVQGLKKISVLSIKSLISEE